MTPGTDTPITLSRGRPAATPGARFCPHVLLAALPDHLSLPSPPPSPHSLPSRGPHSSVLTLTPAVFPQSKSGYVPRQLKTLGILTDSKYSHSQINEDVFAVGLIVAKQQKCAKHPAVGMALWVRPCVSMRPRSCNNVHGPRYSVCVHGQGQHSAGGLALNAK